MSGSDVLRRRWSSRCKVLGSHRWWVRNLAGTERYRDCVRCGRVDDDWLNLGALPFYRPGRGTVTRYPLGIVLNDDPG